MQKSSKYWYYSLAVVFSYFIYAYFYMCRAIISYGENISGPGIFDTSIIPSWIIPILVIFLPIIFMAKGYIDNNRLGFSLGKGCSFSLWITVLLIALLLIDGNNPLTHNIFVFTLLVLLNIAAMEIIFRALIVDLVKRIFGNSNKTYIVAAVISSLIFIFIFASVMPIGWKLMLALTANSLLFLSTNSLLLPIITDSWIIVRNLNLENELYISIIALIFYFALALGGKYLEQRAVQQQPAG